MTTMPNPQSGDPSPGVTTETTLLDLLTRHPCTEEVLRRYDSKAGTCLCCEALFDTLEEVAARYSLDLHTFLTDLRNSI